ncbi:MAG: response regulator transcription factor [Thermoleophilia bacterium]|nr:response regulator transcription factor [Thermoleophilia bacterium]
MTSRREGELGTILVVEDDPSISELLQLYLAREGYAVAAAASVAGATELVASHLPLLVVLDLMLPDGSGLDFLRQLRRDSEIPVIVLTAKDADQDKILGLELGADDYMTKPFNPGELVARVRAVLRRVGSGAEPAVQVLGEVRLLPSERIVKVEDVQVDLTPREFDLLHYLLVNRGIALSRERLLEEVWGYTFYGDARTVDVHIRQLRKKLGPWAVIIQTVWGLGYRADPAARPGGDGPSSDTGPGSPPG